MVERKRCEYMYLIEVRLRRKQRGCHGVGRGRSRAVLGLWCHLVGSGLPWGSSQPNTLGA